MSRCQRGFPTLIRVTPYVSVVRILFPVGLLESCFHPFNNVLYVHLSYLYKPLRERTCCKVIWLES